LPQAPQLFGSTVVSMQVPPQLVCEPGQLQTPAWQEPRPGQALPQLPQFAASRIRSAQLPLQTTRPAGQLPVQAPPAQTVPVGQTLPQPPQF
jgi:hypothetical protein